MKVPGLLIAAALITAGILAPGLSTPPQSAPAGAVGMEQETFAGAEVVTIPRGGSVTFYNSSNRLHVIGPGDQARLVDAPGTPDLGKYGVFVSETGDTFVSGPWNTPGTYKITCQLHPAMNITIVVTE